MSRQSILLLIALSSIAYGAPPGASLRQKIAVPAGMRTGDFSSDQFVTVPPGYQISVWSRVVGARFLAIAPNGDVFVSRPDIGQIVILRPDARGGDPAQFVYTSNLNAPQGLAFDTVNGVTWLYVGESNQIDRYVYNTGDTSASKKNVLVRDLLDHDAHPLKDIAIAPDHTVYFGYGSSCNACPNDITTTPQLAAVYTMNPDGSNLQTFAAGLRNPEGLAFVPGTSTLWAAVNNRDEILYPYRDSTGNYGQLVRSYVDDHPPDLFTSVRHGGNYGWPFCNSTEDTPSGYVNMAFDPDNENNSDGHVDCGKMDRIAMGVQAHSAPLGLAFLQGTNFAAPYRDGAVIAFHGSWDRTVPTGYKVVYFPWNTTSQKPGAQIDLLDGFIDFGRPVGVAVAPDGALLVTDDLADAVYRVVWAPSAVSAASGYAIVAPGSYAAVYGSGLADNAVFATAPYPNTLGDVSLSITDASGQSFKAPLVYVSPSQINFIVPDGMAAGTAHMTLTSPTATKDLGAPEIVANAPGLFSLSGDGKGVAAATAADAQGDQVQVFSCSSGGCAATPVKVSGGPVYLSLYGTGIRNASAGSVQVKANGVPIQVLFAGGQPTYPGLDQVNVALPASLAGAGEVQFEVAIGNVTSNVVSINVQ
jgi:uncharacterized protein (TIGR03437 family)